MSEQIRLIALPKVIDLTGLCTSTIYNKMSKSGFPKPISVGNRTKRWIESEVTEWIENCIAESRPAQETQQ